MAIIFVLIASKKSDINYMIAGGVLFAIGCLIGIIEIILRRVYKYHVFEVNKTRIIYSKYKFSEEKTIDKNKKYSQFVIKTKNVTQIKNYLFFKVIVARVDEKKMCGREINYRNKHKKLIVPYFIEKGLLKDFTISL